MRIHGRPIGGGSAPFVVAEVGINHNGELDLAIEMVKAAAKAGADAVKFQAIRADKLLAPRGAGLSHVSGSVHDFFRSVELTTDQFSRIRAACRAAGIGFIVTPFDEGVADELKTAGVDAFKIASGDITHLPLLRHVARKRRPLILSTGASTLTEIDTALSAIRQSSDVPVVLLHCVSAYPAAAQDMNLRAIQVMSRRFALPIGLSDHTQGIHLALAAVALGAVMIEKHFTISRGLPGPDQTLSVEAAELTKLVACAREVHMALGDGKKVPRRAEREARSQGRRALYTIRDVEAGRALELGDIAVLRPAAGLPPEHIDRLIGRKVKTQLAAGAPIRARDLA
ncbi:MAG: N-acetylneuraminate synthase family protein [Acidobacteria bacterium]|nr:N-acetylneuraminate synthase family protein [Acidobacteriota bacterium]